MFRRVLIANRGEIAVRIIRACHEMGILTVAVFSEPDREALHVKMADEAVCIGSAAAKDSYLNMDRILNAALITNAQAIHPGFGFLSENDQFAEKCQDWGVVFVGPSSELIRKMGNKSVAKETMRQAGIPVIEGSKEPVFDNKEALRQAEKIGFPVMVKAAFGGGGKGMRIVSEKSEFESLFRLAQQEAVRSFGDSTMYLEKYIQNPRHVEVQIVADSFGNVICLGERDCSVQRRHQKMIEESPCTVLEDETRLRLHEAAVEAAKAVGYESAGTVEFLCDSDGNFYFMEMNTRIQVEHPVSEAVTGVDLIREQIRVASGLPLSKRQEEVFVRGHAIECRINAEDPQQNFSPCPGKVEYLHIPGGKGVRVDTAMESGSEILPYYDSMIVKIIVHEQNRELALQKMRCALKEFQIRGVRTNRDFLEKILNEPDFCEGKVTTGYLEKHFN